MIFHFVIRCSRQREMCLCLSCVWRHITQVFRIIIAIKALNSIAWTSKEKWNKKFVELLLFRFLTNLHRNLLSLTLFYLLNVTTVFVDTRLSKTKHPRKRFQNFRQSYVLSTDRIEIHQSQPLMWPSDFLYVMLAGGDWWISIRYVDNT